MEFISWRHSSLWRHVGKLAFAPKCFFAFYLAFCIFDANSDLIIRNIIWLINDVNKSIIIKNDFEKYKNMNIAAQNLTCIHSVYSNKKMSWGCLEL